MCRMIATVSKTRTEVNYWLDALEHQAKAGIKSPHEHGYGVAFYQNGQIHTRREVSPVWKRKTDFTEDEGRIIILHARKASVGSISLDNVHPFTATVDDHSFVFCHNGTIADIQKLRTTKDVENEDITDSRIFFDLFLERYEMNGNLTDSFREAILQITEECSDITSLNSFLSDGERLLVLRYCLKEPDYYRLGYKKMKETQGFVISTEEFPEKGLETGDWNWLENRTLNIFTPEGLESINL
ncbi:MAG TPA: class II glutamine amidotransferase [Thermotogota bacterium]|nr:class II glutamine amidotransferase [Thermotogota bacterium]HPJ89577.1 class II glutamine amidotransferase [Thermotogota bacterium]